MLYCKYLNKEKVLKPNANKEEIIELCRKYDLNGYFINNTLYIKSCYYNDEWLCEIYKNEIILKHKNHNYFKEHNNYHFQRKYRDFNYMFWSIRNHDAYKEKRSDVYKHSRMVKLFELISIQSTINLN